MYERKYFYPSIAHRALPALAGFLTVSLIATQVRGVYMGLAGGVALFSSLAILLLRKENKRLAVASAIVLLAGLFALGAIFAAKDTMLMRGKAETNISTS